MPHHEGGRESGEERGGEGEAGEEEAEARYIFVSLYSDEKPEKPTVSSGEAVEAKENDEKPLSTESAPNTQNHTIGDPTAAGFWDDVEWCSVKEPYEYSRG